MVLLTHQKEKNYFVSPELRRTGLKQIYGSKTLRWSFKRKQLETIQEQKPDYYFKIVLLGDCGTGKTNLANKFSCEACSKTSYVQKPDVGGGVKLVEYVDRVIEMSDKHVLARLYDTAGTCLIHVAFS
jgi:Cdc6-like AAA superfamily ATPase